MKVYVIEDTYGATEIMGVTKSVRSAIQYLIVKEYIDGTSLWYDQDIGTWRELQNISENWIDFLLNTSLEDFNFSMDGFDIEEFSCIE